MGSPRRRLTVSGDALETGYYGPRVRTFNDFNWEQLLWLPRLWSEFNPWHGNPSTREAKAHSTVFCGLASTESSTAVDLLSLQMVDDLLLFIPLSSLNWWKAGWALHPVHSWKVSLNMLYNRPRRVLIPPSFLFSFCYHINASWCALFPSRKKVCPMFILRLVTLMFIFRHCFSS